MAWEKRAGTREVYYCRTRRVRGKRVREYFGNGPVAEVAWLVDVLRRVEAELARRERSGR